MRSDAALLTDIRENIRLAEAFTNGLTFEAFATQIEKLYSVTRCLEIISEASRRLSPEIKLRYPELRWSEIAGAGSVYRHAYERVSADVIWGTVKNALPPLLAMVTTELAARG